MSRSLIMSSKVHWKSPYRDGGSLELMEIKHDGRKWYRVIAIGPEMKDNLVRFGLPTNVDHVRTLEGAMEIFEEYLDGPDGEGRWDISGILSQDVKGFTPNLYFDESISEAAQTETSVSGNTERWSGPGGIVSFNPQNMKVLAKSWKVSERDAWNNATRHEFKHFEDNIKGISSGSFEGEKNAIHEGMESMLEGGAEFEVSSIVRHLMSYGADKKEAWNIVKQWISLWMKKYPDFVLEYPTIFLRDATVNALGRDILQDETRDLSDEDLARRRGLWNEEDEEGENVS